MKSRVVPALLALLSAPALMASSGPTLQPGTAADVLQAVRAPGAKIVLVNVWATWCIPCREEMPDLLRLRHDYGGRGLRLILVSGDFGSDREQAQAFLREQGVDFPTFLKQGSDMEFIEALDPHWSGALPVTLIYDGSGTLRDSIYGKGSYARFEDKIRTALE